MRVGLISTYELGHQPLHVASPAAALRDAGHEVRCLDLAISPLDEELATWADAVAFSVPMHTAMRLAIAAAERLRSVRPDLPVALYGLYAPVSRDATVGHVADRVIAGEYEPGLLGWLAGVGQQDAAAAEAAARLTRSDGRVAGAIADDGVTHLGRQRFHVPARDLLPELDQYASAVIDGRPVRAGYTEATHGCAHECRHCPVPTVYAGVTRVIDRDVVIADVDQQVAMGAEHITFGDPDFLNAWRHALAVTREVHERHPGLTYDVTVKVEHILRDESLWKDLAATGCRFVVCAVELLSDRILGLLDKGHTAADAARAVEILRRAGIEMRPSFLPFTPWTTIEDVVDVFDFIVEHDLVPNVDPVQLSIRLLLPTGSLLLDVPELQPYLEGYDAERLSWTWRAADAAVDALAERLAAMAEHAADHGTDDRETFVAMRTAVLEAAGHPSPDAGARQGVPEVLAERPGLTEPWFCCAEPTEGQRMGVKALGER